MNEKELLSELRNIHVKTSMYMRDLANSTEGKFKEADMESIGEDGDRLELKAIINFQKQTRQHLFPQDCKRQIQSFR